MTYKNNILTAETEELVRKLISLTNLSRTISFLVAVSFLAMVIGMALLALGIVNFKTAILLIGALIFTLYCLEGVESLIDDIYDELFFRSEQEQ